VARAIDEEQLRACPECEQLLVPSAEDYRYQIGYCPFCGSTEQPILMAEAESSGLVEPDGEAFWQVRHGSVPGWVTNQPLPPLEQDDHEGQEDAS
jgi:hypothetical protein